MIIDSSTSQKVDKFLSVMIRHSNYKAGERVAVVDIFSELDMSKEDMKELVSYLIDMKYLKMETMGGPLLYGHISLTDKGLKRLI